ncbi:uncharacterized protein BDR25DRAFT_329889 [Lindgomyces ingoldianus]|uniref:Uncharacterized protein n=1 Tax=Lindgomyces ingoldianus TaxID=673940 RepID=A0ACB6QAP3_9PLEO|nr:uncharacterized protein BDR25DRAFT_329889 [Lindgomyces ingoldianus]KAF2463221.1 hypothetical protein BDR25DRAFT_329889 [Lindgomyces ingoldianus]
MQRAACRVKFAIQALCSVACNLTGSSACSTVTKLPEENFNKTFLLSMTDGREIIAKVLNPNSGRPGLSTASEVKNCLGIPETEIYAWSSQANETAIGTKFIIMHKAPGIQLSELVRFQSYFVAEFPVYGSLYYNTFCVGPTNNRKYFDDGRGRLHLDRGPWRTLEEYVTANAEREQMSIREIKEWPPMQGLFGGLDQYQPSNATKQRVLEDYQNISTLILPRVTSTHAPALSHSDLHTSNIFVDPLEPTRITCIIDWQGAHIAPLCLKLPPWPENYSQLDTGGQLEVDKLREAQSLYKLYEVELLQHGIHMLAGSIFTDGEPKAIVGVDAEGNSLIPCPLSYAEEMGKNQRDMEEQWNVGVLMMNQLIEDLGVYSGWDVLVNNADYQVMKLKLADCKEGFLQNGKDERGESRVEFRMALPRSSTWKQAGSKLTKN